MNATVGTNFNLLKWIVLHVDLRTASRIWPPPSQTHAALLSAEFGFWYNLAKTWIHWLQGQASKCSTFNEWASFPAYQPNIYFFYSGHLCPLFHKWGAITWPSLVISTSLLQPSETLNKNGVFKKKDFCGEKQYLDIQVNSCWPPSCKCLLELELPAWWTVGDVLRHVQPVKPP